MVAGNKSFRFDIFRLILAQEKKDWSGNMFFFFPFFCLFFLLLFFFSSFSIYFVIMLCSFFFCVFLSFLYLSLPTIFFLYHSFVFVLFVFFLFTCPFLSLPYQSFFSFFFLFLFIPFVLYSSFLAWLFFFTGFSRSVNLAFLNQTSFDSHCVTTCYNVLQPYLYSSISFVKVMICCWAQIFCAARKEVPRSRWKATRGTHYNILSSKTSSPWYHVHHIVPIRHAKGTKEQANIDDWPWHTISYFCLDSKLYWVCQKSECGPFWTRQTTVLEILGLHSSFAYLSKDV